MHIVKIYIKSGKATPAPPVGPALGQYGINIIKFCNEFNEKTKEKDEITLPVVVKINNDKTFSFEIKEPTTSMMLKQSIGLNLNKKPGSGSKTPGKQMVGEINYEQLKKIAEIKLKEMNSIDINKAILMIIGTAKSIGIKIIK